MWKALLFVAIVPAAAWLAFRAPLGSDPRELREWKRRRRFERLVAEALAGLPPRFQRWLDNVAIVIEDEPSPEVRAEMGLAEADTLFGLYQGTPRTTWGRDEVAVVPDRILIYRRPIERACHGPDEVRFEVRQTVRHEIGHHFGLSEEELSDV